MARLSSLYAIDPRPDDRSAARRCGHKVTRGGRDGGSSGIADGYTLARGVVVDNRHKTL